MANPPKRCPRRGQCANSAMCNGWFSISMSLGGGTRPPVLKIYEKLEPFGLKPALGSLSKKLTPPGLTEFPRDPRGSPLRGDLPLPLPPEGGPHTGSRGCPKGTTNGERGPRFAGALFWPRKDGALVPTGPKQACFCCEQATAPGFAGRPGPVLGGFGAPEGPHPSGAKASLRPKVARLFA